MTEELVNADKLEIAIDRADSEGLSSMKIAREKLAPFPWQTIVGSVATSIGIERILQSDFIPAVIALGIGGIGLYYGIYNGIEGLYHLHRSYNLLHETRSLRSTLSRRFEMLR